METRYPDHGAGRAVQRWAIFLAGLTLLLGACSAPDPGRDSVPDAEVPACQNGRQDPGEQGVDCGGPCPACPSCEDGVQNQGETGVDCGGPCPACASCGDGVQNQGELAVDCGGPCRPCTAADGVYCVSSVGVAAWEDSSQERPTSPEEFNAHVATLQPGDRVLFRRGDTFHEELSPIEGLHGTRDASILFGAYGDGPPPRFTTFQELPGWDVPSHWAYLGDASGGAVYRWEPANSWQFPIWRVWLDDGTDQMEPLRKLPDGWWDEHAHFDSDHRFETPIWEFEADQTTRLDLWTPDGSNPADHYSAVRVIHGQGGSLRSGVFTVTDCSYLRFQDLEIEGERLLGFYLADSHHVILERMRFLKATTGSIRISTSQDIEVAESLFDSEYGRIAGAPLYYEMGYGQVLIDVIWGCQRVRIHHNRILDWSGHVFRVLDIFASSPGPSEDVFIYDNVIENDAPGTEYCRPFNFSADDAGYQNGVYPRNVWFFRNWVRRGTMPSHASADIVVAYNLIDQVFNLGPYYIHHVNVMLNQNPVRTVQRTGHQYFIEGLRASDTEMVFLNNTLYRVAMQMVEWSSVRDIWANNLVLNAGWHEDSVARHGGRHLSFYLKYQGSQNTFWNNYEWNERSSPGDETIRYEDVYLPWEDLAVAAAATSDRFEGNVYDRQSTSIDQIVIPGGSAPFTPPEPSPVVGTGLPLWSVFDRLPPDLRRNFHDLHGNPILDADGNPIWPTPSIGAIEGRRL